PVGARGAAGAWSRSSGQDGAVDAPRAGAGAGAGGCGRAAWVAGTSHGGRSEGSAAIVAGRAGSADGAGGTGAAGTAMAASGATGTAARGVAGAADAPAPAAADDARWPPPEADAPVPAPPPVGGTPASASGRNASMRSMLISKPTRGAGARSRSRRPLIAIWYQIWTTSGRTRPA